ncbi:MAG: Stp1/IreP family PP2C-type Ser/Thr phosphatase [Solirubrobacteraceae bacterium]
MIRVAEYVALTDTGHQRSTNEDSHFARSPLFVIADGMGGAQAGEVASQLAITHFSDGLPDGDGAERQLERAVQEANADIHALSERDARRAGMGTTLTAAYVGADEVSFAHVGDSRAYLLRDGRLERVTEDHSLVEELLRQGRLTEEEAEEHPQRSIITRALGPEPDVDVDTFTLKAAAGDIFLICSDGLTSMVPDATIAEIVTQADDIAAAAERLVAAALDAGGRDNVTVVLFRLEQVGEEESDADAQTPATAEQTPPDVAEPPPTQAFATVSEPVEDDEAPPSGGDPPSSRGAGHSPAEPAALTAPAAAPAQEPASRRIHRRAPRMPRSPRTSGRPRLRRRVTATLVVVAVFAVLALGALLATQSVYFIGTDAYGQVTIYNGLPYVLPGGVRLYTQYFVSGVTAAELSPLERGRLFNNQLRSQAAASSLVSQLELDRIAGQ